MFKYNDGSEVLVGDTVLIENGKTLGIVDHIITTDGISAMGSKIRWWQLLYCLLFLLILIFLIDFVFHVIRQTHVHNKVVPASTSGSDLSETEFQRVLIQAEQGDIYAMEKLVMYDGKLMSDQSYKFWHQKITEAAIAGNLEARRFAPDWNKQLEGRSE